MCFSLQTYFLAKCGLKHLNIFHIPLKEKEKDSVLAERKSEVSVDSTVVSSAVTGAGDQDCRFPKD